MKATIHGKKKRLGTAILFIVMAVSVFCTGKICLSTERNTIGNILQFEEGGISEADFAANTSQDQYAQIKNTAELTEYLSKQQAELMIFKYNQLLSTAEPVMHGVVENVAEFYIFDNYMEVHAPGHRPSLYHLTEPVDWEYIRELVAELSFFVENYKSS